MAESIQGGTTGNASPKEISMEVRLLLAFLLMGVVMFLSPYFFKAPPNEPAKKAQPATPPAATVSASSKSAALAKPTAAPAMGTVTSPPQPPLVIETDLYRITFSNQGATVRSWLLKKYKGNDNKPLDLVNPAAKAGFPFSLYFPDQKPSVDVNWTWYKQSPDPDGLGVTFEYSDGHTAVRKAFRFAKDSYLSHVEAVVTVDGNGIPSLIAWRGGFGDLTVNNPSGSQRTLYFDVAQNKLVEKNAGAAKNGPVAAEGNFSFAGVADTYFAAVFFPESGASMRQITFADSELTPGAEKSAPFSGVAVSAGQPNRMALFVGPKDLKLLSQLNPKLVSVVDFGWLSFLAKPLFLIVSWFDETFIHNYGWSIVVVTIIINFLLFPLKLSNMKSMRKMQALKPQIDAINEKYKNLKMTDPRKAQQNQEVMELYKKHGVNPMGGCVPMLLQIPFFFAFYKVFTVSVAMRGASWLWVSDLSQAERLPIHILPIIMIASQFFMQKMTPQPNQDPNQARMMMFMPLIFGFMFYNFPSGLVLYYLTSNLVSMGQQWFFNHTEAAQEAARSVEPPKKKNGRK
jgi:YidC/Oxa1 family membrane protein insertase